MFQTQFWFYNANVGKCNVFSYGGCGGNQNRFASEEDCETTCSSLRINGKYVIYLFNIKILLLPLEYHISTALQTVLQITFICEEYSVLLKVLFMLGHIEK